MVALESFLCVDFCNDISFDNTQADMFKIDTPQTAFKDPQTLKLQHTITQHRISLIHTNNSN